MNDNDRVRLDGRVRLVEELSHDDIVGVRLALSDSSPSSYACSAIIEPSRYGRYQTLVTAETDEWFSGPRVSPLVNNGAHRLTYGRYEPELRIELNSGEIISKRLPVFVIRGWVQVTDTGVVTDLSGLWVGSGIPTSVSGAIPGQGYLDELTGNLYVLIGG